jgi:hypothetical protein
MYSLIRKLLLILISLLSWGISEKTEATWTFELFGGSVYSFRTPLIIRQSGYDNIRLNARYETKTFKPPLYYDLRIARWKDSHAWELEFIHQKLYLRNRPPEVQNFSITHGYNLFTLNRAWMHRGFIFHLGAGIVITHPETTVRGMRHSEGGGLFNEGYYISGPTILLAIERRFYLRKELFATVEGKITGSYTRIPIQDGGADVTNLTVHGLLGLGYNLKV